MRRLDHYWYHRNWVAILLRPLSWLFRVLSSIRRLLYHFKILNSVKLPVPVIIVGNISVGGTGKTPLTIALVELLKKKGYTPGVITRGYGGELQSKPAIVTEDSDPYLVSDEAVLLAQRGQCLVAASPDRIASSRMLIDQGCDIIVSDDGLQHYRLQRDIEIAVVDAARGFGNGYCLPAGPLREPIKRLATVDFVVMNSDRADESGRYNMIMRSHAPRYLTSHAEVCMEQFVDAGENTKVHAIAAIGNPQRFFRYLTSLGLVVIEHAFADHHRYQREDIVFNDHYPVFMTEKDAVKCRKIIDDENYFYIAIDALLDESFKLSLMTLLTKVEHTPHV
ncbi:MAG: tetraacyldisaccharide 4'-kinase [Gammaproteobacteria bacterium]|nr:tetraacyldisaccharide 4'-kinase [Gammaproteobacteria bacterium]PCH62230.1 MAG: tetraacyldisaccharide 4'-kinase [Gammaproteobacteria bacterium]